MKRSLRYRTANSTKLNRFNSAVAFNGDFRWIRQGQTDKRFLINLAKLYEANLKSRQLAVRLIVSTDHRKQGLGCARDHANLQICHLRSILITDKLKFCVDFNDGRCRI